MEKEKVADIVADAQAMFAREKVVKLPHRMALIGHLMNFYQVPAFAREDGKAFHYTDAAGLFGIASSNKFWDTHLDFLNDPTEGRHGIALARQELAKFVDDPKLRPLINRALPKLDESGKFEHFVVSFSRDGDLLSQWRGYGAFGSGYSLGFDLKQLQPHPQVGWLIEVGYNDIRLRESITVLTDIFRDHIDLEKYIDYDDLADWLVGALRFLSEAFKHPGYSEEREIRLIFSRLRKHPLHPYEAPIQFRPKGASVVPYLATPLGSFADAPRNLPLTDVMLGPGVPEANMQSVADFLKSVGHETVHLHCSTVPFTS